MISAKASQEDGLGSQKERRQQLPHCALIAMMSRFHVFSARAHAPARSDNRLIRLACTKHRRPRNACKHLFGNLKWRSICMWHVPCCSCCAGARPGAVQQGEAGAAPSVQAQRGAPRARCKQSGRQSAFLQLASFTAPSPSPLSTWASRLIQTIDIFFRKSADSHRRFERRGTAACRKACCCGATECSGGKLNL